MVDINVKVDVPGAETVAKSADKLIDASTKGVGAVLGRICLPAAEELGLLFQDRVRGWRVANLRNFEQRVEQKLGERLTEGVHAHPRLTYLAMEQASMSDDDVVQDMWASLLAGACTHDGTDQSNFIFMEILSRLSPNECRLLEALADRSRPVQLRDTVALAGITVAASELAAVVGISGPDTLAAILLHLEGMQLLTGSNDNQPPGEWVLSLLGVAFYVRCQGFIGPIADYFGAVPDVPELKRETGSVVLPLDVLHVHHS